MTIISPDRTRLVESIARTVAEHGGNYQTAEVSWDFIRELPPKK